MIDWEIFEQKIKEILKYDNAKTVPGSGNGKHEEDIIGLSTIVQCKHTNKKNISILYKDLKRLIEASDLQEKMPIFASKAKDINVISLICDNNSIKDILRLVMIYAQLNYLKKISEESDVKDIHDCNILSLISNNINREVNKLKEKLSKITSKIEGSYLNSITYNLFDKDKK